MKLRVGIVGLGPLWEKPHLPALRSLADRFESFGWQTLEVDGHDIAQLLAVLSAPPDGRPRAVIARTIKGKGLGDLEGKLESHYATLDKEQHHQAIANLEK